MKQKEIKILVVDDEIAFANTLAQRLKMRDYKVGTAYDGEQALSKLKEEEPDVIVLGSENARHAWHGCSKKN